MDTTDYTDNLYDLKTRDRIRLHTTQGINEKIDQQTVCNILNYSALSREDIINRIQELNKEWDIDRAIMANFAVVGSLTLLRGLFKRRSLGLLGLQLPFLLFYAAKGWCPPLPLFRRLGFRTKSEIEAEKNQLLKLI